ncbi:hypothetical protein BD289DRAFT_491750, partial [Coniella lustricola]
MQLTFYLHATRSSSTYFSTLRSTALCRHNGLYRLYSRWHSSSMTAQMYRCDIDAEPLHRYQLGGYHPIALGDILHNGRYKILHKLGWGGYSTTWAAKDKVTKLHVAVKISVSSAEDCRENEVLRAISSLPSDHPGRFYVNQMLDQFTLTGPNGTHNCLVLELLGPNVAECRFILPR